MRLWRLWRVCRTLPLGVPRLCGMCSHSDLERTWGSSFRTEPQNITFGCLHLVLQLLLLYHHIALYYILEIACNYFTSFVISFNPLTLLFLIYYWSWWFWSQLHLLYESCQTARPNLLMHTSYTHESHRMYLTQDIGCDHFANASCEETFIVWMVETMMKSQSRAAFAKRHPLPQPLRKFRIQRRRHRKLRKLSWVTSKS